MQKQQDLALALEVVKFHLVQIINENDYFGEEKLVKKGPYEGTVKTLCETKLYRLTLTTIQKNVCSYSEKCGSA